jgi:membrane protease YdiL (CAAX protease family)
MPGLGSAFGGLITSIALSTVAAFVLSSLGMDDRLEVGVIVTTIVAGWAGLLAWLWFASCLRGTKSFSSDYGLRSERFDALRGIGFGFVGLVCVGLISALLGERVGDPTFSAVDPSGSFELFVLGAAIVVGAPIVEELFFRGLFLRAARRRVGAFAAVITTSAIFGLLHVPQREALGFAQAFLPLFAIGVVLGSLAVRYGRLGPSIYAHMTINAIGFLGLVAGDRSL